MLVNGPHGRHLIKSQYLPFYVLTAHEACADPDFDDDLQMAVVIWRNTSTSCISFSFFNNHKQSHINMDHFVVDGLSTYRRETCSVGKFGKGFLLAIQWFFERCLEQKHVPKKDKGCSFRAGHHIGVLDCNEDRAPGQDQLDERDKEWSDCSDGEEEDLEKTHVKIFTQGLGRQCFKGSCWLSTIRE
jgi:hypothetical protein